MVKRKKKVDHEKRADALAKELGTVKEAAWKLVRALEEPDSYTVDGDIQPHMANLIEGLCSDATSGPSHVALYEGQFYSITGQYIRALPKSQVEALGLVQWSRARK